MDRSEWLKQMRQISEALYDRFAHQYWESFGFYENETHLAYLQKFLEQVTPGGPILSAACGAGRYDGLLLDAGHPVVGIDQSEGMLARAKEHFPQVQYRKLGLQELDFREAFDGIICLDAMEHICPEDYPMILRLFQAALKPGGLLYFTADREEYPDYDLQSHYDRAVALGLPVVYGEVADEVSALFEQVLELPEVPGDLAHLSIYHYYPPLNRVREWIAQAGLTITAGGEGSGLHHFLAKKNAA